MVTQILAMLYISATIVIKLLKSLLDVNLDFVTLVALNMLRIELCLWLKNLFVANIDISFLLCPINFGLTFKNIDIF